MCTFCAIALALNTLSVLLLTYARVRDWQAQRSVRELHRAIAPFLKDGKP